MPSTLPKPSGPYNVSFTDIVTDFGKERSLFRLFYPTASTAESITPWISDPDYVEKLVERANTPCFSWLIRRLFSGRFLPASLNADLRLPSDSSRYPIIIFSHGLGLGRMAYCNVCMDIASHGAVVASVEHSDQSACATYYFEKTSENLEVPQKKWIEFLSVKDKDPNEHEVRNRQVHIRADECSKVLDHLQELNDGALQNINCGVDLTQFKDTLDLDRCAIVGHSFGGGTAVAAVAKDKRYKVAVAFDPWMYPLDNNLYRNVPSIPLLLVNAEYDQWPANVVGMRKLDVDTLNVSAERKTVTLKGAVHMTQTDILMFIGWNWLTKRLHMFGDRDPADLSKLSNRLMTAFIGLHLEMACGQELEELTEKENGVFWFGSNLKVDEAEVERCKEEIRSF